MKKNKHIGKYQIVVWCWKTGEPVLHKKHFIKDIDKANRKRANYQLEGYDVKMWLVGENQTLNYNNFNARLQY